MKTWAHGPGGTAKTFYQNSGFGSLAYSAPVWHRAGVPLLLAGSFELPRINALSGLTRQNMSSWNVSIRQASWAKYSFGVPVKGHRPPYPSRPALLHPRGWQLHMQILMIIWRTIIKLAKQAWLLPETITLALQHRRRQITRHQFEIERLDRLRNPSKYAGR